MTDILFTGLREFEAAVDAMIAAADVAAKEIVTKGGQAVQVAARDHMHGRPGPRSGVLADSVAVTVTREATAAWRSEIGSEAPYGRRIELGFHGTDSLGRHYDQGPFPFLRPGFDDAAAAVDVIATTAWFGATRAG